MAQRKTIVRSAKHALLSAATRAIVVERGPVILERGGRTFVLDEKETQSLLSLIFEPAEEARDA